MPRTKMTNVNPQIDLSQGIGTLISSVKAPVVTTQAGKSALAFKAHADRNPGQVQIIEVPWLRTVEARN